MTLGRRIHAAAVAFAVGYLFVGSVVLRSEGALAMSVPKVLLGVAVGWVVWMATGEDGRKGSAGENLEAPAAESVSTGEATAKRPLGSCGGTVLGAMGSSRPTRRSRSDTPYRVSLDRMKRLSELAFCDGRVVEAAYWLAIALLHGGTDRSERMRDYVEAWLAAGCPDEGELVHSGFTAAQSSFGRSVLRFHSGTELALAIARFDQMAKDGDDDAKAFLETNGIGPGGAA